MTKSDLISVVATKTDLKKKDMEVAVNAVIEAIIEGLVAGDKIQISGFGAFETKGLHSRSCRWC